MRRYFFAFLLGCCACLAEQKVVYESTSVGKSTKTEWRIEREKEGVWLKGTGSNKGEIIEYLDNYVLTSYAEKLSASRELTVTKEGTSLVIKGKDKGKEKLKSFKLGKKPWIQNFKFGFRPFLTDSKKELHFYIVNPKDFDVYEMVATKEEQGEVEILGTSCKTQKMKITLAGFKKKFWKAEAWFDQNTFLLVKYRANEGPGTPYTETILVEGNEGV